jgi:mono/diheme cytochrome c family protein
MLRSSRVAHYKNWENKSVKRSVAVLAAVIFLQTGSTYCQSDAQANYSAKCQACHGSSGAGDTPVGRMLKVKPLNDPRVVSMTDSSLTDVIDRGSGKMPGYQEAYTSDQITNLVQYLHQLQTKLQGN